MNATNVRSEGALYELLCRGNKDVYFFADDKTALYPYDNAYKPHSQVIHETRLLPPLQAVDFGRPIEFEFEIAGDVVVEPTLVIELPTWLPEAVAAINTRSLVTDTAGVSYGYTRGIAYFLFSKIQFFQDRYLVQEWSGDSLFALSRSLGTLNSAFLENALTGTHDGSARAIGWNATPGKLRLPLPIIGCQHLNEGGFPRVAATTQAFRVRCILRKIEDLVEASDGRAKPQPWERKDFGCQTVPNGNSVPFTTIGRNDLQHPTVMIETRHIYTDRETQDALKATTLTIPFESIYENNFTQGSTDYAPITRGGVATVKRLLDGNHPVGRIVMAFHSMPALRANQYWNYTADISGGQFYNKISLLIASRDRETAWDSSVWHTLECHAKEERDPGYNLSYMNWTLGDTIGRDPAVPRQLEGSINFTTAHKPTLLIDLTAIPNDPVTGNPNTTLDVYVEGWAAMEFEKGRSAILFGN